MTLTLTPSLLLQLALLAVVVYMAWRISAFLLDLRAWIANEFDQQRKIAQLHQDDLRKLVCSTHDEVSARADSIINGDKAILDVAKANNEFLRRMAGVGMPDKTRRLRQSRELNDVINEAAANGVDMTDVIAELKAQMDEDRPA